MSRDILKSNGPKTHNLLFKKSTLLSVPNLLKSSASILAIIMNCSSKVQSFKFDSFPVFTPAGSNILSDGS